MGVITFILGLNLFAADNPPVTPAPPVTIHLELAKDTLTLAEPTMLRVEVMNNTHRRLILDGCDMFCLYRSPYPFTLHLTCPDGEEKKFEIEMKSQLAVPNIYFYLSKQMSVSMGMLFWWTPILPERYQRSLESLPAGNYKLYAVYHLPKQGNIETDSIYSDTAEFVFLPPVAEYVPVLIIMDSLWDFFHGMGQSKGHANQLLPSIVSSGTPYSEAAAAWLTVYRPFVHTPHREQFDRASREKAAFDSLFPDSEFESYILYNHAVIAPSLNRYEKKDSLVGEIEELVPNDFHVLLWKGELDILKEWEIR